MIKIVQGNDVNLHVPLVEKDAEGVVTAIDFANVTELSVQVFKGSEAFSDFTLYTVNNTVVICLNENAPKGSYSILITAKNNGVDICYNAKSAFEIVRYNAESTYTDYIADEDVTLDTGLFVAATVDDAQVARLREELREAVAEARDSKTALDEEKERLVEFAEGAENVSSIVEEGVQAIGNKVDNGVSQIVNEVDTINGTITSARLIEYVSPSDIDRIFDNGNENNTTMTDY